LIVILLNFNEKIWITWCTVGRSPRYEIVFGVGFSFAGFDFLADAGPCHSSAGRNFSFLLSSQVHCLICFWFCRFQFSSSGSRPGSSEIFILRHSIHFFLAIFFSVIPLSRSSISTALGILCAQLDSRARGSHFPVVCSNSRGSAVPRVLWLPVFFGGSPSQFSLSLCLVCCSSRCACLVSIFSCSREGHAGPGPYPGVLW
jgi:hypothetical protein